MTAQMRVILLLIHETAHDSTPNGSAAFSHIANGQGMSRYDMPDGVSPSTASSVSEALQSAGEAAHSLASRLITIRSEQHAKLPLRDFLAVFRLCWSFVLRSELTNKRMITGLRAAAKAVEEERWDPVSVPALSQKDVDRTAGSATQDPADFILLADDDGEDEDEEEEAADEAEGRKRASTASEEQTSRASKTSKTLHIEEREYYVVGATLDVLTLLGEYLRMIVNLPLLTTEAMTRFVEFLKQVNSRTCQVVLGAGAMCSAGLRNITAKNLALASQTLSVFISFISYIRETVRGHLSVRQAFMLTESDKPKRDCQEHQYEIHAKLVSIMNDRLIVHSKSIRNVDWNCDAKITLDANK
ncbi:Vps54-domain-containing protein [Tilletiaria anomala UBC 951]|uniref:Vps54-domain-containing protein n=1 Tax=Tilletiaria anomala (strain ATCC 24038 / CBS 436.72 / UBC 951) TaxID=1037660 RepID=A0A066VR62_TILAU|nr:Vps54-domain-containing protein [Tilletiaria anomala UBC 951]KDN43936.1 Vps54-domain-containing protein [Tilletiaria anomala UBC 951]